MIDLHMHTTHSDGALTPAELLQKCETLGLEMISITDHNNMNAYRELMNPEIRALFSGKILPGCEITSHYQGMQIEILGFGMDPEQAIPYLNQHLPTLQEKQTEELERLIALYRERGFPFEEEKVREHAKTCINMRAALWKELNLYPENRALYTDPASAETAGAFTRREAGNLHSPFFFSIAEDWPDPKEVCTLIHRFGGRAIIAHPGSYNKITYHAMEDLIRTARPDGLEAWYLAHTPEQREHLLNLCQKHGLIFSGGSDAHGTPKGMPGLEDLLPTQTIMKWANTLPLI